MNPNNDYNSRKNSAASSFKMSSSMSKYAGRKTSGPKEVSIKQSSEEGDRRLSMDKDKKQDRRVSRFQREEDHTIKFVYSEAVERALRSEFKSSAFPPVSRTGRAPENYEIVNLPNIYQDLTTSRKLRRHNIARERSYWAKERHRRKHPLEDNKDEPPMKSSQRLNLKLASIFKFKQLKLAAAQPKIQPAFSETVQLPPIFRDNSDKNNT